MIFFFLAEFGRKIYQYGKPAHEGDPPQEGDSPSRGGLPLKSGNGPPHEGDRPGSPSRGYFSLCITIYRRKNQNCKKPQWCLWRFMCPLSMHQFIEISICALENKINSNISMSSDPWKSVRQWVFPCTAAETIGRTKLPSSVWEENKFRGFPYKTPTMPVVYRRSSRCLDGKKT